MSSQARFLADEVTDAFRVVIAGALALAVVLFATVIWFIAVAAPASANASHAVALSNNLHSAMLDEQSSLRAYVVTGDASVLTAYRQASVEVLGDQRSLSRLGIVSRAETTALVTAQGRWQQGWADQALDPATRTAMLAPDGDTDLDPAKLAGFIRSGRSAFTATEAAQHQVLASALHHQSLERRIDVIVIGVAALLLVIVGAVVGASTVRRRRRLQERVVGPVRALLEKVQAVGRGEFAAVPPMEAPAELLELRDELANMSGSLRLQQQALAGRAEDVAASNRRLKMVLAFAREVSESLTPAHSLSVVATAARRFADSPRARVWLVDDAAAKDSAAPARARMLRLRHDSITGEQVPDLTQPLGYGGLGQAAQTHRVCRCDGLAGESEPVEGRSIALAVPMVKGPRLIGVIEILLLPGHRDPTPELLEMLEAMAAQAATSIDAAILYELAESLSLSDPLTGLANRRQLDHDLTLEVERAARYHRPLSFLMIDIDRFKSVNDTFGHAVGDAVLVEVASVLSEQMRLGDSIYRYGGEEFAVLARETDLAGAQSVAERLRRVVAERYATQAEGDVAVTISIGVAELNDSTDDSERIVSAADEALYAAKRGGRNRVEVRGQRSSGPVIPRVRIAT